MVTVYTLALIIHFKYKSTVRIFFNLLIFYTTE